MAEQTDPRVAVYIDFDNIVISQYDAVHGRGAFMKERARTGAGKTQERLREATVDIGAVLDFASSFGEVAISRAYADWAAPANNRYQKQLVDRAVDLVQLFNTAGTKNGASTSVSFLQAIAKVSALKMRWNVGIRWTSSPPQTWAKASMTASTRSRISLRSSVGVQRGLIPATWVRIDGSTR